MRILGLDYGSVTLGVSVSDIDKIIASPIKTIRYKNNEELFKELDEIFNTYQ